MSKTFFFYLLFIFVCCKNVSAQAKTTTAKSIEKEIVKISETLYAFRCETSNLEYNGFLNAMTVKDSGLYEKYCIDSLKWLENFSSSPHSIHYHRHPGFNDYPVVCVPYEGAVAYCDWLTDLYNTDPQRKFRKVKFVLPTEQEWELAALGILKEARYPWGTNSLRDTRKGSWQGQFLANYKHVGDASIVSDSSGNPVIRQVEEFVGVGNESSRVFYTAPVRSFYPNKIGIYNLSGNAAEMTIIKGLTKGGSWNSYGGEITIAHKLYFYEPSPEVGFRVFMKIEE